MSLWKTINSLQESDSEEVSTRVKSSLSSFISLIENISSEINDLSLNEILEKIYKESNLKSISLIKKAKRQCLNKKILMNYL